MRKTHLVGALAVALALFCLALPRSTSAQVAVGISVHIGPPALPVYAQPICPGPDYIWTPGYWAYGDDGYYWVPGTWVLAPQPGYLWTPGWWGFAGGAYVWHAGYWGPHVGFYGGINYGFGYFGAGFVGGEWRGGHFFYNTAVSHVNVTVVRNVYVNRTVINNVHVNNHVSFNGGPHGINARPSAQQQRWDSEQHVQATSAQQQHFDAARSNTSLRYSANHGHPNVGATQRPGEFTGRGATRTNGNQSRPAQNQPNRGAQPNNRQENRNATPGNENRPAKQPHAQPAQRGNRPAAKPQQPRGNQGGERGGKNNGGDRGKDDGGR